MLRVRFLKRSVRNLATAAHAAVDLVPTGVNGAEGLHFVSPFLGTFNSQLRTDADKGNPTV